MNIKLIYVNRLISIPYLCSHFQSILWVLGPSSVHIRSEIGLEIQQGLIGFFIFEAHTANIVSQVNEIGRRRYGLNFPITHAIVAKMIRWCLDPALTDCVIGSQLHTICITGSS